MAQTSTDQTIRADRLYIVWPTNMRRTECGRWCRDYGAPPILMSGSWIRGPIGPRADVRAEFCASQYAGARWELFDGNLSGARPIVDTPAAVAWLAANPTRHAVQI